MIKNLLFLSVMTIFTVVAWIGFTIYHNLTTSTISKDAQIRTEMIVPVFDKEALNTLTKRKSIPVDLAETVVRPTITENSEEAILSSPSARILPRTTPTASVSPTLRP